jgi:hypothetical protein
MKTEAEVWRFLKPLLNRYGLATRIENAANASVPDIIYACKGYLTYVELKIDRDRWIYMPPYQYSYGVRLRSFINPNRHWIAVCDEQSNVLFMYLFTDIITAPTKEGAGYVGFQWNALEPRIVILNQAHCEIWVSNLL